MPESIDLDRITFLRFRGPVLICVAPNLGVVVAGLARRLASILVELWVVVTAALPCVIDWSWLGFFGLVCADEDLDLAR